MRVIGAMGLKVRTYLELLIRGPGLLTQFSYSYAGVACTLAYMHKEATDGK